MTNSLRDRPSTRFLFLERGEWSRAIVISAAVAGLAAFYSYDISIWISVTVFLTVLTLLHMTTASRFILPLPHVLTLMAALQYVLAAWISYYWPPLNPTYDIGERLPLYLSYAGPSVLALAVGWALVLINLQPKRSIPEIHSSPRLLLELDVLLGISVVATFFAGLLERVESLGFVFILLSNLRYLSVYARMLLRGPGWTWRLAVVLGAEVLFAAGTGMLHTLLLWSLWTFAMWIYRFAPSRRAIFAVMLAGLVLLPALQESKWRLRQDMADTDPMDDTNTARFKELRVARVVTWAGYLANDIKETVTLSVDRDFIADIAVRYNQGWIINRVMAWVPEMTPYAAGATIKDAAIASIFPRFVFQGKVKSGGRENMLRYAGIELTGSTSMNLGYAGELYANFGQTGGLIGCGLYAVALGLLFRVICRRAFIHPLWWSLVPYIFFAAVKAEDGIDLVANWSVKSCILLFGISMIFPGFRQALFSTTFEQPSGPLEDEIVPEESPFPDGVVIPR